MTAIEGWVTKAQRVAAEHQFETHHHVSYSGNDLTRKVNAACLDCGPLYEVTLFEDGAALEAWYVRIPGPDQNRVYKGGMPYEARKRRGWLGSYFRKLGL